MLKFVFFGLYETKKALQLQGFFFGNKNCYYFLITFSVSVPAEVSTFNK